MATVTLEFDLEELEGLDLLIKDGVGYREVCIIEHKKDLFKLSDGEWMPGESLAAIIHTILFRD